MQACPPDQSTENPAPDLPAPTRSRSRHPSEPHLLESAQKVYDFMLRPITVVITTITAIPHSSGRSHRCSDKCAVPAILSLNEGDVRVRGNLPARLRRDTYKRIIRRVQHQRRHRDALDDVRSRSTIIVIVHAPEAAIVGRHFVVKLAETPDATQTSDVEVIGEMSRLLKHAPAKRPQEIFFVNPVRRFMQRIRRSCQINRRTTYRDSSKLRWRLRSPFS